MSNEECFLCQKPNCTVKCAKPNCDIYYCSDAHYAAHTFQVKKVLKPNAKSSTKSSVNDQSASITNGVCDSKSCTEIVDDDLNGNTSKLICLPYKIVNSERFGRHFVATRDIKPLELILVDDAAVVGPATKTNTVCIVCLNPSKGEFRYEFGSFCLYVTLNNKFYN